MVLSFLADLLLAAGAFGAGCYCFVLSRRLTRFTDLEKGVGGAVAVLSVQVDEMTQVLTRAQSAAATSSAELREVTAQAEAASERLTTLLQSMQVGSETVGKSRTVRRTRRTDDPASRAA